MVEYLLAHGAVVDAGAWDGVTPLMLATMHDRYDAAVMLFDAGANPNAENAYGSTPFHYVRDARIILALIDHGGDVHRRCANGQTPIFQVSSPEAVDVLIAHGAELDIVDQQGNTPLMVSLAECDIDIERGKTVYLAQDFTMHLARLMIARGMDLNTRNAEGKTALAIAEEEGFTGFPDFLQAHGAKK
jgi:ankyrin repeat protein